jgi:hypothetical protein
MERMPCNDTRASSLPTWLHLEASPTGLRADRQGLALRSWVVMVQSVRPRASDGAQKNWRRRVSGVAS